MRYAPHMLIAALAETADATDYDETLLPVAILLLVVALVSAAVATWIVTPRRDH